MCVRDGMIGVVVFVTRARAKSKGWVSNTIRV